MSAGFIREIIGVHGALCQCDAFSTYFGACRL